MAERRLLISFSGGETSALMAKLILDNMRGEYDDIRTVFANTGQENEATLEFVDRCDKAFGLGVVWIEALPSRGRGNPVRVVDFVSASRDGAPLEAAIQEYGLPGPGWLHCTREAKTRPILRWAADNGWAKGTFDTAIGMRADETYRVSPTAKADRVIYPLITRFPHTKPKVNEFWFRQPFRLELKGYEGNCMWCWKKSLRKHLTIITEHPERFDFPERMEREYAHIGAAGEAEPRRIFRQHRTVADIRHMAATTDFKPASDDARQYQVDLLDWLALNGPLDADMDLDACGAGESCEVEFGDAA
jgi:hypothetical protein